MTRADGEGKDFPFLGMCFEVSAKGHELGSFSECSGLNVEIGSEEYKEGGSNHFVHKLPTHATSAPLILKRGLDDASALWDWIREFVETSTVKPADIIVQLKSRGARPDVLRSWTASRAYPLKWEGPKLDAARGQVAFETVEFAHRGIVVGGGASGRG
ncbi:phage tail protein [Engelhardtia mirabilis]|uniref:T4-like virus tail tube protein gp19 n=1 Tax=Engelhardtia mirabilis TaxID=2528011 RepID=A0A518BPN6_9BACT|nr:T4-like virus tail tube protein gp19 [Planctomycetes bacterium Pla133]QDV03264.1 T4-like virus tail tube protein gp19 [Planctomycetes bacterium Pla86]